MECLPYFTVLYLGRIKSEFWRLYGLKPFLLGYSVYVTGVQQNFIMCCSRKCSYPPHGRLMEIPRGRRVSKAKFFEWKYDTTKEFLEGWGVQFENPYMGGVWIFSWTTQCRSMKNTWALKILAWNVSHLPPSAFPGERERAGDDWHFRFTMLESGLTVAWFSLTNHNSLLRTVTNEIASFCIDNTMGVARIFQRGGHTDSYRGYSSDCHLNIVSCLLTRRLTKGGSRAPQDPPWLRLWIQGVSKVRGHFKKSILHPDFFIFLSISLHFWGYNLGQYKNGIIIPHPPQSNDEGTEEQKRAILASLKLGGGVVQMFHLFWPRL